jgi:hypothetical protein
MTYDARDPHVLAPGRAPTPFTAEEIRDGCPAGRTIRLRVDMVGQASFQRCSRFAEDLPGMPVRYLTRTDGEVVTTVTMVSDTRPTP